MLLYGGRQLAVDDKGDFLSLSMVNQLLQLRFNLGNGHVLITYVSLTLCTVDLLTAEMQHGTLFTACPSVQSTKVSVDHLLCEQCTPPDNLLDLRSNKISFSVDYL